MIKSKFKIFFYGVMMGVADSIPGVSGGTVALLLGIYPRLLRALSYFKPTFIFKFRWHALSEFWKDCDGAFLTQLGFGILVAITSAVHILHNLFETSARMTKAGLFGLVTAVIVTLIAEYRSHINLKTFFFLGVGFFFGLSINYLPSSGVEVPFWMWFLAGFLSLSAMILPGISGSLILVILGVYQPLLESLYYLELKVLVMFFFGGYLGLTFTCSMADMFFKKYPIPTVFIMIGLILGSMLQLWPWQGISGDKITSFYFPSNKEFKFAAIIAVTAFFILLSLSLGTKLMMSGQKKERC